MSRTLLFLFALFTLSSFGCGSTDVDLTEQSRDAGPADGGHDAGAGDSGEEGDTVADGGGSDGGEVGACQVGQTRACYSHGAGMTDPTIGRGICKAGTQQCTSSGGEVQYGECTGEVGPEAETCNGVDDDCDGTVDEACPTGVSLVPAGESKLYGGSGGSPFDGACDPYVVTGIEVTSGANIDSLAVQCGEVTLVPSSTAASGFEVVVTDLPAKLGPFGGNGGYALESASCPANTVVSGFYGWHGTRVDSLGIECSELTVEKEGDGTYVISRKMVFESPLLGSNGGSTQYDAVCAGANVLSGFKGNAVPYLYKVGGKCSTLSVTFE